jgi:two-component system LytT family response regulator
MISPPVRTLIVEDEPLARRAVRSLVVATNWLELVGEAEDGSRALELIETQRPELVLLDIHLPGVSGVDVLSRAGRDSVVIFTTAHDDYALVAFELGAIDYVRKPFGRERLGRALDRAAPQIEALRARIGSERGDARLSVRDRMSVVDGARAVEVIYVRERGSIIPIPIQEIQRLEADGDFVAIFARGRRYLVYVTLGELSVRLDPERFIRVHRSHVVNLSAVAEMTNVDANRVALLMRDGIRVLASRAGTRLIRERARMRRS